jgi:hypothetical protein
MRSTASLAIIAILLLNTTTGLMDSDEANSLAKSGTYAYIKDIVQNARDVKLIKVHFTNAFRSGDSSLTTIDSISQLSDSDPTRVITASLDEMTITADDPLILAEGYELSITGIDNGEKNEFVNVELKKNNVLVDSRVISIAKVEEGTFSYFGDRYGEIKVHFRNAFLGVDKNLVTVDSIWQVSDEDPSYFIMINDTNPKLISSGTPLKLEEGYQLAIKNIDVSGNRIWLELFKDGMVVDSDAVTPQNYNSSNFIYKKLSANEENPTLINISFKNIFRGPDINFATINRTWQASDKAPSIVLICSSKEMIINTSTPIELNDGYDLVLKSIDVDGNKAYIELRKDNHSVSQAVIALPDSVNGTFIYSKDIGQTRDANIINISFKNVFRGAESNLVTINGIWQASDKDPSNVLTSSSKEMIINHSKSLDLNEGYELTLRAIDVDGNKAYLELNKDNCTVHSAAITLPNSVNGTFIYSKDVGEKKDSILINVSFKEVFRGSDDNFAIVNGIWQASEKNPSIVLNRSSKEAILNGSTPIKLDEGYEISLKSIDVDGNKAYLELSKDNRVVHSAVIIPAGETNDTFIYSANVGRAKNVKLITIHLKNLFFGRYSGDDFVIVDRIWQVSDRNPSRVLYSSFSNDIIYPEDPLYLEDGYEFIIDNIDRSDKKAYVELRKFGQTVARTSIVPSNFRNNIEKNRTLNASYILSLIEQGEPIECDGIVVEGDLDLGNTKIEMAPIGRSNFDIAVLGLGKKAKLIRSPIIMKNSDFRGNVRFNNVIFNELVDFEGSNFTKDAMFKGDDFRRALFKGSTFGSDAQFEGSFFSRANFQDAKFLKDSNFNYARFGRNALFDGANYLGDAYFWGTSFSEGATFQDAMFNRNADFSGSEFNGDANFRNARFINPIYIRNANFSAITRFDEAQFDRDAFFDGTNFNTLNLKQAKYERLYLRLENIKNLVCDDTAYLLLIKNFNNLGFFDDANECYYQYRKANLPKVWSLYKPLDAAALILYGYGVKPMYPIIWAIVLIGIFGFFYRIQNPSIALKDSLRFSAEILISGSRPFMSLPMDLSKSGNNKKAVLLERVLGTLLFALFIFALGRTIIRG